MLSPLKKMFQSIKTFFVIMAEVMDYDETEQLRHEVNQLKRQVTEIQQSQDTGATK